MLTLLYIHEHYSFTKGFNIKISFGRGVKTEIKASNIAIPVKIPKYMVGIKFDRTNIEKPKTGLESKFSYKLTAAMSIYGKDTSDLDTYSDDICFNDNMNNIRDKVIERVINKIKSRSDVGYKKYGVTLHDDEQSLETWLTHIQEELMDAVN